MIPRERKLPKAYDVLDTVLLRGDAQELARLLSCSPQLIRAWCRPPESDDDYQTGRFSPLDRIRTIISLVREADGGTPRRAYPIGEYIAQLLGGVFVPLSLDCKDCNSEMMLHISDILKESGEVIDKIREIWCEKTPGKITPDEARQARKEIDQAIVAFVNLRNWVEEKEQQGGANR